MVKVIDSIQYHVWSDALHARQLARATENPWDRGAYVRWAIQTAWSAFESVCTEALAAEGLGMRFKDKLDAAVAAKRLPPVAWGHGIWQQVLKVYSVRKEFVHVVPGISHDRLKTPLTEAEQAIVVLRGGIRAVSDLAGVPHPPWVSDDGDRGWQGARAGLGGTAHARLIHAGATEADPDSVRLAYVISGIEYVCEICPPGTPHGPLLDKLLGSLSVPVEAVRAYRGSDLLEDRKLNLR
jgi:hypothetical protein